MSFHGGMVYLPGSYRYTRDPYIDGGPITGDTRVTDESYTPGAQYPPLEPQEYTREVFPGGEVRFLNGNARIERLAREQQDRAENITGFVKSSLFRQLGSQTGTFRCDGDEHPHLIQHGTITGRFSSESPGWEEFGRGQFECTGDDGCPACAVSQDAPPASPDAPSQPGA